MKARQSSTAPQAGCRTVGTGRERTGRNTASSLRISGDARLPTRYGEFHARAYEDLLTGAQHLGLIKGVIGADDPVLVRVHSECLTGDVLGSQRCDCGAQLDAALEQIAKAGRGILLYLRQEGRGIGLFNKIRAYALQDGGLDTVQANEHLGFPPDLRDYAVASQMLDDLGARELRLLTNNPNKMSQLREHGLKIVARVPLLVHLTPDNGPYLRTKRDKLGHLLRPEPGSEPRGT